MDKKQIIKLAESFLKQQRRKKPKDKKTFLIYIFSGIALYFLGSLGVSKINTNSKNDGVAPKGAEWQCDLVKVYDGDTVTADCNNQQLKIRLGGIDAPEMKQAPYGTRSKEALQKMLKKGNFTIKSEGPDFYQRTLGFIFIDGENINLKMVSEGHAVAYDDKSTPKEFVRAEAQAKKKKLGIWAEEGLHQDPKQWRRYNQNK